MSINQPHLLNFETAHFVNEIYIIDSRNFPALIRHFELPRMDYLAFLSNFDRFADVPVSSKKTGNYREYLNALKEYLITFLARTRPLLNVDEEFEKVDVEFDKKWKEGTIPGWTRDQHSALAHSGAYLDLSSFETATDLEALGLDRLKSALIALGLKCGGTLKERAERLFATKGHKLSEMEKTALAKRHDMDQKEQFKLHQTARLEAYIQRQDIYLYLCKCIVVSSIESL
ncbi:Splicing factor 3A subunit 3 [Dirofilaria immitis]|nr:Splicing factor 3A subunit 3 [Dirofilaria immitis]